MIGSALDSVINQDGLILIPGGVGFVATLTTVYIPMVNEPIDCEGMCSRIRESVRGRQLQKGEQHIIKCTEENVSRRYNIEFWHHCYDVKMPVEDERQI